MTNITTTAEVPIEPPTIRLADYRPYPFKIDHVALVFHLDNAATRVASRLSVRRAIPGHSDAMHLYGEELALISLHQDGAAIDAGRIVHRADGIEIAGLPDHFTLDIETRIDPAANTSLSGLYLSQGSFFTQCEAEGFRRITYFPDRPDVMSRYTVTVSGDKSRCPVLLSNGNLQDQGEGANGTHWATWDDPHPKPCYLFALVAGDLHSVRDTFTTASGRHVDLAIYMREGDQDRCGHAMRSLKASMTWDEEVFGLEYDLDIFNIAAVSDFNMGAMENKGLNVFNTRYVLARPESATDGDYQGIETVIAHEYFHNWTGNRVTCRDWFQLSLKEGLTVFRDQQFTADQNSAAVERIANVRSLRAAQFAEDAGPLAHPVRPDSYSKIDNFYTATVYQKGAEVVRMLHTVLGKANFRKGMDLYFARHDNSAATIEDFVQAMHDASGIDLTLFRRWYDQAGTPEVTVSEKYDAQAQSYTLTLRQHTPPTPRQADKIPLPIPVAMGLLDQDGNILATRLDGETAAHGDTRVLILHDTEQSFVFHDVARQPIPSLLRGFSAPVKLHGLSQTQLMTLAAHDCDPFVRWESAQTYLSHTLMGLVAQQQQGIVAMPDQGMIRIVENTLRNKDLDPALAAQTIALPSENLLADRMEIADPEAIHHVRQAVRLALGRAMEPLLRERYAELNILPNDGLDGASMSRRALKNICLGYLGVAAADGAAIAFAQFQAAKTMTDRLSALLVLTECEAPERDAALDAFYKAWHQDDLVLDKWFSAQAMSSLLGTPTHIAAMMARPDFELTNPNRVRAVLGAFMSGNPRHFHDRSGKGYRVAADTIIALDKVNSQVAARMLPPLCAWRRQNAARQAHMIGELRRILTAPQLSAASREIVGRAIS